MKNHISCNTISKRINHISHDIEQKLLNKLCDSFMVSCCHATSKRIIHR